MKGSNCWSLDRLSRQPIADLTGAVVEHWSDALEGLRDATLVETQCAYDREITAPTRDTMVKKLRHVMRSCLTKKQRVVVEAYFFLGLSQHQIARDNGVSQQVIQKRLFGDLRRGRKVGGALTRLRTALEKYHG